MAVALQIQSHRAHEVRRHGSGSTLAVQVLRAPRRSMAVYRRRRVAVASAIASLVMLVSFASHAAAAVLGGGSGSAGAGASAVVLGRHGGQDLVEGGRYLVQPGDTLWTIARALQPRGDVSGLVHRLERLNGGAPLAIGQQLQLPN